MPGHLTMRQILKESPIPGEHIETGSLAMVGGMYHVTTGVVDFYDPLKL